MYIKTMDGLLELMRRYEKAGADDEELRTVRGCIIEGLAMDEIDYENTPDNLKKCWEGLH